MAIKLGSINFDLGADTAALEKSATRLARFGQEVDKVSRRQSEGAEQVAAAYRRQEAAMTSALQKTLNLTNSIRRVGGDSVMVERATQAFERYSQRLASGQQNALQMQRANERLASTFGSLNRELSNMKAAQAQQHISGLTQSLRALSATTTLAMGPLAGVASRIAAFGAVVASVGGPIGIFIAGLTAGALAVTALGKATLDAGVQMQQIRMQLTAVTGSSVIANAALEDVGDIARKSGQDLASTATAYAKFMAAANGTALAGEKAREIFETMSMAAGKMALPTEQTQGILKALEQMMSKATIQAEELRGQLGDRLPGAFIIMADALGVSTRELGEMMKAGEVLSDEALPKFAAQVEKVFNLDGKPIDTFTASMNNLSNETLLFFDALDQEIGVSEAMKNILNDLAATMTYLRENIGTVGEAFSILGDILGVVLFPITEAWKGIKALASGIEYLYEQVTTISFDDFIAKLNPVLAVLGIFNDKIREFKEQGKIKDGLAGAAEGLSKTQKAVEDFTKALPAASAGSYVFAEKTKKDLVSSMEETRAQIARIKQEIVKPTDIQGGMMGMGRKELRDNLDSQVAKLQEDQQRLNDLNEAIKINLKKTKSTATIEDKGLTDKQLEAARDALTKFNLEYANLVEMNEALSTGDKSIVEQVKKQNEMTMKLNAYKQQLEKTLLTEQERADALNRMGAALRANIELTKMYEDTQKIVDDLNNSMDSGFDKVGDALGDMVSRGKFDLNSLAEACRDAAADILSTLFRVVLLNPLKEGLFGASGGSGGGGILGSLLGGVTSAITGGLGSLIGGSFGAEVAVDNLVSTRDDLFGFRALGGPVVTNGMYVAGEYGPEIVKTGSAGNVISNDDIRQMMSRPAESDGGGTTVVQNFNISTGVSETVRAELNEMMPGIINQTKSAVADARMRGGQFAQTFRKQ